MNKYLKILLGISIILLFAIGTVSAIGIESVDAAAKKTDKKVSEKKEFIKFKILKKNSKQMTVIINNKKQVLKREKSIGKYSGQHYGNKRYKLSYGARGTTKGSSWSKAGYRVFDNRVYSLKTGKPVSPWGSIKTNPKGVSDGEFTCYNPGTRYNDMDFCSKSGYDKAVNKLYYLKRVV